MTNVSFDQLPDDGRVWVFATEPALDDAAERSMLAAVGEFLGSWHAHGHPLRAAHEWRDRRFLAIGVDQSTAGASGCSIDGLFRIFKQLEPSLGAQLLPGGRVFWRDASGAVTSGDRAAFAELVRTGAVGAGTRVFDTTVSSVGAWRASFERPAAESWHWTLAPARR